MVPLDQPVNALTTSDTGRLACVNLSASGLLTRSQEYFNETVGHVRRVELEYGREGKSRGKAEILFNTATAADVCFEKLNKLPIDGRPIKVEIIRAQPSREALKSLSERAGQPKKEKAQPKSAADTKKDQKKPRANQQNKNGVRKPQDKQTQRSRNARPVKKSVEELDLEMADYFDSVATDNVAAQGGNAPAVAAGGDDAAMEDEIS